jgi:hypothetical protein
MSGFFIWAKRITIVNKGKIWYNKNTFKLTQIYCIILLSMKMLLKIKNWFFPTKENNFTPSLLSDRAISIFILLFLLIKVVFSFNLILVKQSSLFADVSAQQIFSLTNEIRQQYGLSPVEENNLLNQAAQYKAEDMLQNSYFSHYSPTGISPWYWIERSGYDYYYAGENLAMNFLDSEEVIKGWFNSPSHRENLLNTNYQEMGIAVISGDLNNEGINRILVVQLFGATKIKTPIALAQEDKKETPKETEIIVSTEQQIEEEVLSEQTEHGKEPIESTLEPIESILEPTKLVQETEPTEETIPLKITQTEIPSETIIGAQLSAEKNIITKINNNIRDQMNLADRIISGLMMLFGGIILIGIILQRQSVTPVFSELVLRSIIIFVLGISFITFQLENVIGRLIIS